jgi:chromosome segregation ATPase
MYFHPQNHEYFYPAQEFQTQDPRTWGPGGWQGGGGGQTDRRLDRLERQVQQLDRRVDQLNRRLRRVERQMGWQQNEQW